ncbi:hypothetical protein IDH50_12085 [Aeromicrobium tamlense]|uniref:DUF6924 domain-containing protein n=1 Tax=Aeromicrobium tamlense TaxID=375541 RepID=A0A8I0FUT3_9ACTN|nr:hypothetical protein [Aeromicrobium tamlense]MBD1270974.1 hypothetical protein [Aeromicrobium tamlense]NYI38366.1 hypothetical protein [Aeromicrobium tamlense]
MVEYPNDSTPLVRTWFEDDDAWQRLLTEAVTRAHERDEYADIAIIDDPDAARLSPSDLTALHRVPTGHSLVIVADRRAMTEDGHPLLVLRADGASPPEEMRAAADQIALLEINVALLANLDWEDFATHVGPDGVFRGFG